MVQFSNPPCRAAGLGLKPRESDPVLVALASVERTPATIRRPGEHNDAFAVRKTWRDRPRRSAPLRGDSPPCLPPDQATRPTLGSH